MGSYREEDIIDFLKTHLEPWKKGRDWRILLADDYAAHKSEPVWRVAWSRGYILLCHGGGATPVAQTPDTDLNEHVRRRYGEREAVLLAEKMRIGVTVPKLTHEECMCLMFEVLSDPALHRKASEGYKKVGASIDLHGTEDALVCREAGTFWNEETTDKYPSMRPKINAALADVTEEWETGGLVWSQEDAKRLITPYPVHKNVDSVLQRLGEDAGHDALEDIDDGGAESGGDSSQETDSDSAVAGEGGVAVAGDDAGDVQSQPMMSVPLSASQADAVHQSQITIAVLEAIAKRRCLAQANERKEEAENAIAVRDAAVAELQRTKISIQELESARECRHALKTFTLEAVGAGSANAGGARAKKTRFDVLDRLSRQKAGLSVGQKNDWTWFKDEWDKAMVSQLKSKWAEVFSGWMQELLENERSNAFSTFVYNETCRVLSDTVALHV